MSPALIPGRRPAAVVRPAAPAEAEAEAVTAPDVTTDLTEAAADTAHNLGLDPHDPRVSVVLLKLAARSYCHGAMDGLALAPRAGRRPVPRPDARQETLMLLIFGKTTIDTRGLPRIAVMNSHGYSDGTTVYVLLESRTRAAVEKWAKRLGVPVVESAGGNADDRQVSAETESDSYRLHVYTYVPAAPADSDPAEFPFRVWAQPQDGARWIVNAFRTRERAERFAERHPTEYGELSIKDATAAEPPAPLHWPSRGLRTTTSCAGEPLTAEAFAASEAEVTCLDCRALLPEETTAPQQQVTHHAVMRHGIGGPECGTSRTWEQMTRDTRAVTCPACLATLTAQNGGAS